MAAVYVSTRPGSLVTRFGTRSYIGAIVKPGKAPEFVPGAVVELPEEEWNAHLPEYLRAVRRGELVLSTRQAFEAHRKTIDARDAELEAEALKRRAARDAKPSAELEIETEPQSGPGREDEES